MLPAQHPAAIPAWALLYIGVLAAELNAVCSPFAVTSDSSIQWHDICHIRHTQEEMPRQGLSGTVLRLLP